jgi:hypothetical protein
MIKQLEAFVRLEGEFDSLHKEAQGALEGRQFVREEVELRVQDVARVLKYLLLGRLTQAQVIQWAEFIEMNEFVWLEVDSEADAHGCHEGAQGTREQRCGWTGRVPAIVGPW